MCGHVSRKDDDDWVKNVTLEVDRARQIDRPRKI